MSSCVTKQRSLVSDLQKSNTLAKVVHGLMSEWEVQQVTAKIDGRHRDASGGTWVPVAGIEIPCIEPLYGAKTQKSSVRKKSKQCERDLMFQKNTSIHFIQVNFTKSFFMVELICG